LSFFFGSYTILDDVYLLQFLRVRKFNVHAAFQTMERTYVVQFRYPQFFGRSEFAAKMAKMMEMMKTGCVLPFTKRGVHGQKFVLLNISRWNVDEFNVHDYVRLQSHIHNVLLEEEITQICGICFIFDYTNVKMRHFFSPNDLVDYLDTAKKCSVARIKGMYFVNPPSLGKLVIQTVKSVLSEKINKRLIVFNSIDELKNVIDPAILPKEYGGNEKTIDEMMQDFYKLQAMHKENVDKIWDFGVDRKNVNLEKVWSSVVDESVGSFRKLEID
jgi:CRAL/TRIO domain